MLLNTLIYYEHCTFSKFPLREKFADIYADVGLEVFYILPHDWGGGTIQYIYKYKCNSSMLQYI